MAENETPVDGDTPQPFTNLLLAALDDDVHELASAVEAIRAYATILSRDAARLAYIDTPELVAAGGSAAADLHERARFRRDVGPALTARDVCRLLEISRRELRLLLQDRRLVAVFDRWADGLVFPEWQFDIDSAVIRASTAVVIDSITGSAWESEPRDLLAWMTRVTDSCFGERISAVDWIEEGRSIRTLSEVLQYAVLTAGQPRRSASGQL